MGVPEPVTRRERSQSVSAMLYGEGSLQRPFVDDRSAQWSGFHRKRGGLLERNTEPPHPFVSGGTGRRGAPGLERYGPREKILSQ